jgi:hypothetical protein
VAGDRSAGIAAVFLEMGMGRCFSFLGMMVFAVGMAALVAMGRKPAALAAPTHPPLPSPERAAPRLGVVPALVFHAPFSLN